MTINLDDLLRDLRLWQKEWRLPDNHVVTEAVTVIERLRGAQGMPIYENAAALKARLWALADRIVGIQEDLPNEDDRAALGEAAHWLCKFAERYNQQEGK